MKNIYVGNWYTKRNYLYKLQPTRLKSSIIQSGIGSPYKLGCSSEDVYLMDVLNIGGSPAGHSIGKDPPSLSDMRPAGSTPMPGHNEICANHYLRGSVAAANTECWKSNQRSMSFRISCLVSAESLPRTALFDCTLN